MGAELKNLLKKECYLSCYPSLRSNPTEQFNIVICFNLKFYYVLVFQLIPLLYSTLHTHHSTYPIHHKHIHSCLRKLTIELTPVDFRLLRNYCNILISTKALLSFNILFTSNGNWIIIFHLHNA